MGTKRLLASLGLLFAILWCNSLLADLSGAHSAVVETIDSVYSDIALDYQTEDDLRASVARSLDLHLTPTLDFDKFTKLILASHWKKATQAQRERITEILKAFLFRTLTKAIVDHRQILMSYKDHIVIMDALPGRSEDRAIVSVVVHRPSSNPVKIDFRMGFAGDRWTAYDVIVQDVSFAINYRAILNSEIRRDGIEQVIEGFASKLKFETQ